MNDKLDELHYIYKMIGNYGFCTVKELLEKYDETVVKNRELDSNNRLLVQQLKDCKKENNKLKKRVKESERSNVIDGQMTIDDFIKN